MKALVLLCIAALTAGTSVAHAQEAPRAIWTGAAGSAPVVNADREYTGARSIGDVLSENAATYRRTAILRTAYASEIQGRTVTVPAGTPFVARIPGIQVTTTGSTTRSPEPARGTVVWCALPASGAEPCFFWQAEHGVHGQVLMIGPAPSQRGWLGAATPAPMPDIVEQDAGIAPVRSRIVLQESNAEGFVLQSVIEEGGATYARSYPRQPWNEWRHTFVAPWQRMRVTPRLDAGGAVIGANVEFTRERPPQQP